MAEFRIYFYGLLSHIGDARRRKRHLAIINDNDHTPFMAINGQLRSFAPSSEITFSVGSGDAVTADDFDGMVPHLSDIGGVSAKDGVLHRTDFNAVTSYVRYPSGMLSIYDRYVKMAQYIYNGVPLLEACAARTTVLTATIPDAPVTVLSNGTPVGSLLPNQCMFVGNVPKPLDIIRGGMPHFPKHGILLQSGTAPDVLPGADCHTDVHPDLPCSWIETLIYMLQFTLDTGVEPECSNSQWP